MSESPVTDRAAIDAWSKTLGRAIGGLRGAVTANRWRIVPFGPILDALGAEQPARVFDIGGGEGLLLFLADRAGLLSAGLSVDANARNIASGARALRETGAERVSVRHTDTIDAWPDEQFDAVTMIDVLHHIPPQAQEAFVDAACARVRPGGLFIYKDMADNPFWMAAGNRLHDLVLARQWIHYASVASVEAWIAHAGFGLERSEVIDILWYRHELRVFRKAPSREG